MTLERGPVSAPPTPSRAPGHQRGQQVAISIADDDELDMEIERGGAMASLAPASSMRPSGPVSSRPASTSGRPGAGGSGLEITYRRLDARAVAATGPSTVERLAAWALPIVVLFASTGSLVKLAHRPGGRDVTSLLPHAFDATSTVQSGGFAVGALVLAIAVGFIGLKARPRSYAMLGSATAFLLASLAMVTVTLVSTDEDPVPPDGALLIPYVVPLAVLLLGLGIAGRGRPLFLQGGARRIGAVAAPLCGGALVFAAIEISALASRLP